MQKTVSIKINFCGGIISPGELFAILEAAKNLGVKDVSFGLRQQLFIVVIKDSCIEFCNALDQLHVFYEVDSNFHPNMISSYPAEEVFITNTWLSEGVYKDIFDLMDYQPKIKINISDSNQSFTPMLTGNINWIAAPGSSHFWHLFIRFPKTNIICEWTELVYTNDLPKMSKYLEEIIFEHKNEFFDNPKANGDLFFKLIDKNKFITQTASSKAKLAQFNLPYYEGLNKYNDKYWLGIYRRDERFSIEFLQELCTLSLKTKIGQLCSTSWKTIMIKGIEEKDKLDWNKLLAKYLINVRHAANELNFQIEDGCNEGLELKNFILKRLHKDDTRTFGVCIGIKTRNKSEIFSSILVKQKFLFRLGRLKLIKVYDVLCANEFNPNERTGKVFSKNVLKVFLAERLQLAIHSFYNFQENKSSLELRDKDPVSINTETIEFVHQCPNCFSIYDEKFGDAALNIAPGTLFAHLPPSYACSLCETDKDLFIEIERNSLTLKIA